MRIGILTFHRSVNNGAVMQCYSLCKRLQKEFPEAKVEVIDYHMPRIQESYQVSLGKFLGVKRLKTLARRILTLLMEPNHILWQKKRAQVFRDCIQELPLSERFILDDKTDELFRYIEKNYDLVIAGSDAIWNYISRGFPNPYFLSESITIPKMSYAASCYGLSHEKVPDEHLSIIGKILNTYQLIGVRDDESETFAREMGCQKEIVHTCDPTVFLDVEDLPVKKAELESKLKQKGFAIDRKSIGVMGSNAMCKMVRQMYGKEYQIVSLYNYCRHADVNLFDLTPYEWAYVFRYLQITFTTFFHGTLLSLRNGTPVISIALETEYSKAHMTKVEDFLRRIGLEECYFHTDYSKADIARIKEKADQLMQSNCSNMIRSKMDQEAKSAERFVSEIRKLFNDEAKEIK